MSNPNRTNQNDEFTGNNDGVSGVPANRTNLLNRVNTRNLTATGNGRMGPMATGDISATFTVNFTTGNAVGTSTQTFAQALADYYTNLESLGSTNLTAVFDVARVQLVYGATLPVAAAAAPNVSIGRTGDDDFVVDDQAATPAVNTTATIANGNVVGKGVAGFGGFAAAKAANQNLIVTLRSVAAADVNATATTSVTVNVFFKYIGADNGGF